MASNKGLGRLYAELGELKEKQYSIELAKSNLLDLERGSAPLKSLVENYEGKTKPDIKNWSTEELEKWQKQFSKLANDLTRTGFNKLRKNTNAIELSQLSKASNTLMHMIEARKIIEEDAAKSPNNVDALVEKLNKQIEEIKEKNRQGMLNRNAQLLLKEQSNEEERTRLFSEPIGENTNGGYRRKNKRKNTRKNTRKLLAKKKSLKRR